MRIKKDEPTYKVDLLYPLDMSKITTDKADCFGLEYDMTSSECPMCADNEVCAIVYMKKTLAKKVEVQQEKDGIHYLDECMLHHIDEEALYASIKSGITTVGQVAAYLKKEGKTSDDIAVTEWLKRFKASKNLSIKQGIIWKQPS